jgi:hypothetical protein
MRKSKPKKTGQRRSRQRGRPPLQALDEAHDIAARRGDVIFLPGGRSDTFDLIICEKFRTIFVRIRRTDLYFSFANEVLEKYRYDIARAHRLPLTEVTAREFWLRLKNGTWQFFIIRHNGLFEIQKDGKYSPRAELPRVVPDQEPEETPSSDNGGSTTKN